jgi:hypothetical protein
MWMFRWLQRLFAARQQPGHANDPRWVEPSNAITRAILSGLVSPLPNVATGEPVLRASQASETVPAVQAPEVAGPERSVAQPVTRTAQRSRRRRASRAA